MPSDVFVNNICVKCPHSQFKWWSRNKNHWRLAKCFYARNNAQKNRANMEAADLSPEYECPDEPRRAKAHAQARVSAQLISEAERDNQP